MTYLDVDGPARDRWGRPLVVPLEGGKPVAYTRCTTYVDALEDKFHLGQWYKRMTAYGMGKRADLVLGAAAVDDPSSTSGKKTLDSLAEQAMQAAQAGASATIGTALHSFTERVDAGTMSIDDVPDVARPDIAAYLDTTRRAGLEHVMIEQFAVHDGLKIGGTPDRVVRLGDELYVADVKTGSVAYGAGKFSMQFAVYARSVPYYADAGRRADYPGEMNTDRAILIHLPAGEGTCELHWVDILSGWEAVQHATFARHWRNRKDLLTEWCADEYDTCEVSSDVDAAFAMRNEIHDAPTVDTVRALWTKYVAAGWEQPVVTALCRDRIAELNAKVA